jgi:hypothetical protein
MQDMQLALEAVKLLRYMEGDNPHERQARLAALRKCNPALAAALVAFRAPKFNQLSREEQNKRHLTLLSEIKRTLPKVVQPMAA